MIFKVLDNNKIPVILSKSTWFKKLLDPIFGHPEVKSFLPKIKTALKNPDYIYQSSRDPRSKLFFLIITRGIFSSFYLVVVVKYVKEQEKIIGYVSTVMINRKLPKISKLIWERKVLV